MAKGPCSWLACSKQGLNNKKKPWWLFHLWWFNWTSWQGHWHFWREDKWVCDGSLPFWQCPSHQKRADNVLSARKMPKNPAPNWVHRKGGTRMRNATLPNGQPQNLYFDDYHPTMPGWFKGMEIIIWEHGLWPEKGLLAQCENFRCKNGLTNCCCQRLLFVNRISGLKSLALRSSSHSTGTFVTSIWSTIVSLTLLNSIGALQNFIITTPCGPLTLLRWRKIWLPALTMSHCFRLYGMLTVWYLIWIFTQTDSHLNLDMQTGLQDSFWHMTLGYWVQRPLGPIKNTMDITHYLQSCLQRFCEPKLTCLHLCSNILSVFSQLTLLYLFFFFEVSIWPLLAPSQWLHKNAGIKCCLSYPLKCVKKTDPQFFKNLPDVLEWEDHFSKIWKGLGPPPPKKKITI